VRFNEEIILLAAFACAQGVDSVVFAQAPRARREARVRIRMKKMSAVLEWSHSSFSENAAMQSKKSNDSRGATYQALHFSLRFAGLPVIPENATSAEKAEIIAQHAARQARKEAGMRDKELFNRVRDAIEEGDTEAAAQALSHGAPDPRHRAREKQTLLMMAARGGHLKLLPLLIPASDARDKDKYGRTALMHAAECCAPFSALLALLPFSDPAERAANGQTLLMKAVDRRGISENEAERVVDLLLPLSNPEDRDQIGNTALMHAARCDFPMAAFKRLLAVSDARATNKQGESALLIASNAGHASQVAALLPHSDVNAKEAQEGNGVLALAAASAVPLLLAAGADAKARNNDGQTPLMMAASMGDESKVAALIQSSEANARDAEGKTAFYLAVEGHEAKCAAMLARVSDATIQSEEGESALDWIVKRQQWGMLEAVSETASEAMLEHIAIALAREVGPVTAARLEGLFVSAAMSTGHARAQAQGDGQADAAKASPRRPPRAL